MSFDTEDRKQPVTGSLLDGGWLALPLLATLGGAWAFARPALMEGPAALAAHVALVVGGWLPFWHAVTHTDWASPLALWKRWTAADTLPAWPYVQPDAPGAALHARLGQAHRWWRDVGATELALPLRRAALGAFVSLLLGLVLGRSALLLTLCFLACSELAVLWSEGAGEAGPIWTGIALAGLPWVLGASLAGELAAIAALSGLALSLVIGFYARRSSAAVLGPIVGGAFLVWQEHPAAAGWLLLLALPGLMVLTRPTDSASYRRATGPWVLGMVAVMAAVL